MEKPTILKDTKSRMRDSEAVGALRVQAHAELRIMLGRVAGRCKEAMERMEYICETHFRKLRC